MPCDALGAACVEALATGTGIARLGSVSIPAGQLVIKVWLQDEAGNAEPLNAATVVVDPSTLFAPRAIGLNPPVLDPGPAAPALRVKSARRRGSTLTLAGTIARRATARITAKASRGRTSSTLASARTKPKRGRWTLRLKLTSSLRRADAFYVTVAYAGQKAFRRSTVRRRLVRKPGTPSTSEEFSLEARSER